MTYLHMLIFPCWWHCKKQLWKKLHRILLFGWGLRRVFLSV
uniref:Uncharacterized protein n=1 Tax=Rhizophora mucronata TaxID=61149 RepID=A0A2P2R501_RHIMU